MTAGALVIAAAACTFGWAMPMSVPDPIDEGPSLQVTLFGIEAIPGASEVDPKLSKIAAQLRKLRGGHGFQLRGVVSRRLAEGEAVECDVGDGLRARTELVQAPNGQMKVRLKFTLLRGDRAIFTTTVSSPPNQLFFCEQPLPEGHRLLIGVGAR